MNKLSLTAVLSAILILIAAGCGTSDSDTPSLTGESKTYTLSELAGSGVSGTATFRETEEGTAEISLELQGTPQEGNHPAHIHLNSAAEGGDIAISLEAVDGSSGMSTTLVETADDGSPVSYAQLLAFDGYINVHLSPEDLTVVAQGDIGANELTGNSTQYTLQTRNGTGVSGTVTMAERADGTTLATIELSGTPDGGNHPAHIHQNSAVESGPIAISFTNVDGSTGMSRTQIEALDDGTAVTYSDLVAYDGYVNVHLSPEDLTVVAQGDVGGNALTGNSAGYDLAEVGNSGVSGTVTFYERSNGTTLGVIALMGTPDGGNHPAHIHENSVSQTGPIAIGFNNIDGTTGESSTQIDAFSNGTEVTYDELLSYNGYVNIHLSPDDLSVVAQGNIGANAN